LVEGTRAERGKEVLMSNAKRFWVVAVLVTLAGAILTGANDTAEAATWQAFGVAWAVERGGRADLQADASVSSTTRRNPEQLRITVENHARAERSLHVSWALACWAGDTDLGFKTRYHNPTIGAGETWVKRISFDTDSEWCWLQVLATPGTQSTKWVKYTVRLEATY
jgi:hypothetical protein